MGDNSMKVLSVCISDIVGGAARATYRIHQSQQQLGVDSRMLVKKKHSGDPSVILLASLKPRGIVHRVVGRIRRDVAMHQHVNRWNHYLEREDIYMSDSQGGDLYGSFKKLDYDVLHLHWINQQFVSINQLPKDKPIVWTLHDTWVFCGVCHYFMDCSRYEQACGDCPLLHSGKENDLSRKVWKKKSRVYKHLNLHFVAPSQWLGECAKKSSLLRQFPVSVIPNCLDVSVFRPYSNKEISERWFDLQEGKTKNKKKFILYGAMRATEDKRKGFSHLLEAMRLLTNEGMEDTDLLVYGATESSLNIGMNITVHYLGNIYQTEELVSLYNLADVMVVPSLAENLSCSIMESLSCETPVVAFDIGGNQDMVEHQINGYIAKEKDDEDLARGIKWCLDNNEGNRLGQAGRKKVLENYTYEIVGKQYKQLYESVSSARPKGSA